MTADVLDGGQATLQVIANTVIEIGLNRLSTGLPVHINYPAELLVESPPLAAPAGRVVIEVLESVRATEPVVEGISALRERGHRIALDDYSPDISDPDLLALADIVKIDISQHSAAKVAELVATLRRRHLTLIAEHVETAEELQRCIALGFDGYQGFFLQHPLTFTTQRVPSSRLGVLRLMAMLQDEETSTHDIEEILSRDVSLSYRVLRCINSSYYGLPNRVDSIRQAVLILGLTKLQELCALVALQGFSDRPPSLIVTAMTRARMCERLADLRNIRYTAPFFITGLFSMLDALTGTPMRELIDELPLAEPVARALLESEGDLGATLRCVAAYERGTWDKTPYGGLDPETIGAAYLDAVSWAEAARTLIPV